MKKIFLIIFFIAFFNNFAGEYPKFLEEFYISRAKKYIGNIKIASRNKFFQDQLDKILADLKKVLNQDKEQNKETDTLSFQFELVYLINNLQNEPENRSNFSCVIL